MPKAVGKIPATTLLEEEKQTWETPNYTPEEIKYLSNLQKRLERAKRLRERPFDEFDGMTYTQYWQKNEDLANIKLKPKINKYDIQFQTGTLRTKLFAFLSSLLGLNLKGDISAFDENDIEIQSVGDALEDIIDKADELDNDEEKRMLRQYELLKQGDVFVEEIWEDQWIIEKEPVKNYQGQFRNVKINKKEVKKPGRPVRNIIPGLSVYLGDLTKYHLSDQPYIFTVQTKPYKEAEKIYGKFEMWKYVSKTLKPWSGDTNKAMIKNNWRLLDMKEGMVEIIKYQDKPNNEYQIIINGVPMLPPGFPFPWGYNEYNIVQQHLKPIRHNFAYGKSFIFENKNPVQLLDEMMKLALLKTQKSFLPPYLNISGRVLTSKVLMPGQITMGIAPNTLVPVSERETTGVTAAEFNMIQELIKTIDQQTASQTFTGSRERGEVTATQIIELQRQARIMMGIIILSASLLEKKLITLRLMNILQNWFNPIDEVVDKARKILKRKYRIISRIRNIEDKGIGMRFVIPTTELPTVEQLKEEEEKMEKILGKPVRIIALNPKELAQAKLTWIVNVNPREKKSSELGKLMFRTMIADAIAMGLKIKPSYIQERFAEVWEEDPHKMFETIPEEPKVIPSLLEKSPEKLATGSEVSPTIKKPRIEVSPESPLPGPKII